VRGPSIAIQIIALLTSVLIVGQIATFAIVLLLPPPRPPVYRIEDVAAALRGVKGAPRYAPALKVSEVSNPPADGADADFRTVSLKLELARQLGAAPDAVRLRITQRDFFGLDIHRGAPRRGLYATGAHPAGSKGALGGAPRDAPPGAPPPGDARAGGPGWWTHRFGSGDRAGLVIGRVTAAVQMADNRWVVAQSPREGITEAWEGRMLLWFLGCLGLLIPAGYLFARRLTAPISRFARAADQLGRDPRAPPMSLSGPGEIGVAAAAFNEMQARLARYVEDRTAMLASIAHDLRTPLARVQFKLQRAPEALAQDIRSDLGQMEAMISAVLAFVRDVAPALERTQLDLLSLLEVVMDDACDVGAKVELEAGPAVIVEGDASALQRLFVNLVDNAVKYGGEAQISLQAEDGDAIVFVRDCGPGIPEGDLERVFEPFFRLETSRSRDTGGIGLGLAVARSIARAHGGDVTLTSGPEGLTAKVRLPATVRHTKGPAHDTQATSDGKFRQAKTGELETLGTSMPSSSLTGAAAVVLALLTAPALTALPSPAQAQAAEAAQPPKAGDGQHHWPNRERAAQAMHKWREQRAHDLHVILNIRPDQEAAFAAFQASMEPPAGGWKHGEGKKADWQAMSTPEKLDDGLAKAEERLANMRKRVEAVKAFYAVLSPEQKQAFDALHRMHGGWGRHRWAGRGHGWGGEGHGGMWGAKGPQPGGPAAPPPGA